MERGVFKWFNQVSDYGFIAPDDGGPDRYMRGGSFAGLSSTLLIGSRVAFEPRDGGMGPEAINVRPVAPIRRRSTGSFEPARRHGTLDPRFRRRHESAPPLHTPVQDGDGGLSWCAFEARYFPERKRHDLEALKAFASHRNRPQRLERSSGSNWEAEGGALPWNRETSRVSEHTPISDR